MNYLTEKQNIPAWTGLTLDMFINDSAFILYLINQQVIEKDRMEDAVRFFRNNTNLKIEFV